MKRSRRPWSRIGRFGVAFAAIAAMGVAVTPALAEPLEPSLFAYLPEAARLVAEDGAERTFVMFVEGDNVQSPSVTIDTTGLASVATVEFPDECTTTASGATCALPSAAELARNIPLTVVVSAGATAGETGSLAYTTSAANVSSWTREMAVTLADGVDLVLTVEPRKDVPAEPGDVVSAPIEFLNAGNRDADGIALTLFLEHGFTPTQYENCLYGLEGVIQVVRCELDLVAEVGKGYQVEGGFEATVAPNALDFEAIEYGIEALAEATPLPATAGLRRGTGSKALRLVPKQAKTAALPEDIEPSDNFSYLTFDVENTSDIEALGATATGTVGQTVEVTVGIRNNGAGAWDSSRSGDNAGFFYFHVPPGTEVVDFRAEQCTPNWNGGTAYRCEGTNSVFDVGAVIQYAFRLKINQVIANATGTVTMINDSNPESGFTDDNNANNTANVVINPSSGSGGGLPVTGAPLGLIAGAGAAVLVAGTVLLLLVRRRRVVLVAGDDA